MNKGFWDKLPRPFFVLAPMADVTDAVFRRVVAERGKPDVVFTEFVSADGLMHPVGREHLLVNLRYSEVERPIVAQIWSGKPGNIEGAARLVRELGFDGVDINMGCPNKGVEKQGGGASLIRHYDLAREIIESAMRGANPLPVSVKTRIGYNDLDLKWIKMLMYSGIAALTLHLRTRKEMSKVIAHWGLIPELRRNLSQFAPLLIGNGDVTDLKDARKKVVSYSADGGMIGRAIFGNPWLFAGIGRPASPDEWAKRGGKVFETMIEHSKLFEEAYAGIKNFAVMRKFFGAYVAGHPRANELKLALMRCGSAMEVEKVFTGY